MMFCFCRILKVNKSINSLKLLSTSSRTKPKDSITRDELLTEITAPITHRDDKVTIVGVGQVGIATAFTILTQNISSNIVLVDTNENKLIGERLDLQHGSIYLGNCKVEACTDYSKTANSKICIITAGVSTRIGESRLSLVERNTEILKGILPNIVKYSPDTIVLILANPVDVLTYVAWKVSGLAGSKVIGSGTNLDSSRFRFLLSQKLGVAPTSCHGFIIGEHGDSSVAVWSSVNIAGVRLRDINPHAGTDKDTENWAELHKRVIRSANEVLKLKGCTSWAIALSAGAISRSMLRNPVNFHVVTLNAKGFYGVDDDIFLSIPCLLNSHGLSRIIKLKLDKDEIDKFKQSADILGNIQKKLKL